jgi:hypothetical protein
LEALQFWRLPTREDICVIDGAQWILEGLKNGNYHIVDRFSPERGMFREIALKFIQLAHVTVKEIY